MWRIASIGVAIIGVAVVMSVVSGRNPPAWAVTALQLLRPSRSEPESTHVITALQSESDASQFLLLSSETVGAGGKWRDVQIATVRRGGEVNIYIYPTEGRSGVVIGGGGWKQSEALPEQQTVQNLMGLFGQSAIGAGCLQDMSGAGTTRVWRPMY